jgi:alpha,alpha-trehalose phosphorylase
MLQRRPINLPHHIYPIDPWRIVEKQFYPRFLSQSETFFSTGNGYLGMRGCFEEGTPVFENGTFINGFYESWQITYPEKAYGFANTGQTMVNVTDTKIIKLYIDDEPFSLPEANLISFERVLDMKAGTLDREILWEMPSGKRVAIKSRRLVSFQHRHLAAISYEITVLDAQAPVTISSEMHNDPPPQFAEDDPRLGRGFQGRVLLPQVHYRKKRRVVLGHATGASKMSLACGVDHGIETDCAYSSESRVLENSGKVVFSCDAQPGKPIKLTKYMAYHTSHNIPSEELCASVERTLNRAVPRGFEDLLAGQQKYLDDFWSRSDVQIEGHPDKKNRAPEIQQAIRFNLFQILQAAARAEHTGIPAKGLTGQAYDGHYFWDSEVYVLPFLTYTSPHLAKNQLEFRYRTLDKARARAQELHEKGAKFPWRTINGEEASAFYAAGTAAYHINADIMFALQKYVEVTGDEDFLFAKGVEMLVETARLWYGHGFFSPQVGGKFCIHGVTGPDEYTTVVDNNTYTNLMAQNNLSYAAIQVEALRHRDPERSAALADRVGLTHQEIKEWQRAAEQIYIPFDEKLGINPQDDNFLDKQVWDFKNTPRDQYPLLLHFHPLEIYRRQVIKQADMVLAMFLLGQQFSREQKRRNFNYYDPLTTGDSSLSVGVQSILAAEIGSLEKALAYAHYAVLMDLGDVEGNVKDGCHIASMGASWMVLVYGFGGMRDYNGVLSFNPKLPKPMKRLRFPLTFRGQVLEVNIEQEAATYLLREGSGLTIRHQNKAIELTLGEPVKVKIQPDDDG